MSVFIISGGPEGLQRIPFEEKDRGVFTLAIAGDIEAHNYRSSIEDRWVWGEEGTPNDPTLAESQ